MISAQGLKPSVKDVQVLPNFVHLIIDSSTGAIFRIRNFVGMVCIYVHTNGR